MQNSTNLLQKIYILQICVKKLKNFFLLTISPTVNFILEMKEKCSKSKRFLYNFLHNSLLFLPCESRYLLKYFTKCTQQNHQLTFSSRYRNWCSWTTKYRQQSRVIIWTSQWQHKCSWRLGCWSALIVWSAWCFIIRCSRCYLHVSPSCLSHLSISTCTNPTQWRSC
jgi:hypothetical protein